MNRKGFTFIELIATLAIIGIIMVIITTIIGSTLSVTKESAYKVLKTNIISVVRTYLLECDAETIYCADDFKWNVSEIGKSTNFNVGILSKYKYFNTEFLINPINDQKLDDCLIVNVEIDENGNKKITLDDSLCIT